MSHLEGEFLPLGRVSLENVSLAELEEATTKFNKDGNNLISNWYFIILFALRLVLGKVRLKTYSN